MVDIAMHELVDAFLTGLGIDLALARESAQHCILAADKQGLTCEDIDTISVITTRRPPDLNSSTMLSHLF